MNNNLQVKASLFTLILAFMAIGTFAIAKEVMKKNEAPITPVTVLAEEDWYFNGADNPENDNPTNALQYSRHSNEPCDDQVDAVCKISAPADSLGNPNMGYTVPGTGQTVAQLITQALTSGTPNEVVKAFRTR